MNELFRSENLLVRQIPAQNEDQWVVTFDHYDIASGFDREGFSESFLKSHNISAIHVLGRDRDWYQYDDLDAALAKVKLALTGAKRVITYGSSMGAYAAVRFADAVGAHATLALSPQYSIDPIHAPFENRWPQDAQRITYIPKLNGSIRSHARQIIVYDPKIMDRLHVEAIASDTVVERLATPYAGHPAGSFLVETGLLKPLLFSVLNGTVDIKPLQRLIKERRNNSAIYHANLAVAQPATRLSLAIAIARRGVAISPQSTFALEQLAALLSQAGQHAEALDLQRRVLLKNEDNYTFLLNYAERLNAAGQADEALSVARKVLLLTDSQNLAHLHAWHGMIAWIAGQYAEGIEAVEKAVRLHPEHQEYRCLLEAYQLSWAQNEKEQTKNSSLGPFRKWLRARLSQSNNNT